MGSKPKAIVIGAGIGGIAASIRLAAKGYEVAVFEANSYPGGKLTEITLGGYRFDAGPSLFTLPEGVDALFRLCGEDPKEHFQYTRLDRITRYQWPDGTVLHAHASPEAFAKEVQQVLGVPASQVLAHLRQAKRIDSITRHVFLERSLHKLGTYLRWPTLVSILRLPQIGLSQSMHTANRKRLQQPKAVQLFDRYATYNGSEPYRAPATLNVIPHFEFGLGAYFPTGGMHAITTSLVALAERQGVRFHYGQPVNKIRTAGRRASGIRTAAGAHSAQLVISNMDVLGTYRKLLPSIKLPKRIERAERSTSGLIFYWGVKGSFAELDLHNIFFSKDYRREFAQLWQEKTIPDEPTIYLNITSKLQASDAPAGCENWFVMINTPPDDGTQNWAALIAKARKTVLATLSQRLGRAIEPLIEVEDVLNPQLIERRTSSVGGALYGTASNNKLAAFLRHANFSRRVHGLGFVGGSVHPGGGIPLCLYSAKIATDTLA